MMKSKRFSEKRFLIIGGTSRAGTTAVFNYLAGHPEMCASIAKETRFFLDRGYPLRSEKRYARDGAEAYLSFFENKAERNGGRWCLEATPDYLYSQGTANLIHETLPNVSFIFILRDPVSRLISFYRFGRQLNEIPSRMSFDQYVELQKNDSCKSLLDKYRHPAFCALPHGRYSVYLKPYLELFGRSAIHIEFYEDLKRNPTSFVQSICRWAGINESYFHHRPLEVANKSMNVRSQRLNRTYFEVKRRALIFKRRNPRLWSILHAALHRADVGYRKMNIKKPNEVTMSLSTKELLSNYYREEPAQLSELLGIEIPWLEKMPADSADRRAAS